MDPLSVTRGNRDTAHTLSLLLYWSLHGKHWCKRPLTSNFSSCSWSAQAHLFHPNETLCLGKTSLCLVTFSKGRAASLSFTSSFFWLCGCFSSWMCRETNPISVSVLGINQILLPQLCCSWFWGWPHPLTRSSSPLGSLHHLSLKTFCSQQTGEAPCYHLVPVGNQLLRLEREDPLT